jgi:ABC-2 type transport system ATP-binding protein
VSDATVVFDRVSRWYGAKVAVAEVSFELREGVTGLLGHNGAGKTTAMRLAAGFCEPSIGTVRVCGRDPKRDPRAYLELGILHDHDGLWPQLTARRLVELLAGLREVAEPRAAAARALERVGLSDAADRRVGGFSKGMRQRVKLAQALVHEPRVLLLDEPLNGLDPGQRRTMIATLHELADEGRTILVSSHILSEVDEMASRVLVFVNGRLTAEGSRAAIRDLIDDRPRTVSIVVADGASRLARALVGEELVGSVSINGRSLEVETPDAAAFARRLPALAREEGVRLDRVEPRGEDLESVYQYLHERARGVG